MLKFILKKIFNATIVIFVIVTFAFFLINSIHGDPFIGNKTLDPETVQQLRHLYGLDTSLWTRYCEFLKGLTNFDFGYSYAQIGVPIKDLILPADHNCGLLLTLKYCTIVFIVVLVIGMLIGIISVINNGILNKVLNFITVLGFSVPIIILGPLLIQFFAIRLKWFPIFQWHFDFQHLFLPILTLSISVICYIAQVGKMNLFDVMNSQYIKMARAKGLPRKQIIMKHALRPALIPVVSYLSSVISIILTGSVIIERLFGMPGMGDLTIYAALTRDYPVMLAIIVIFSVIFILSNIVIDILYVLIDPKVQLD